jgi:hypothetical protein
VTRPLFRQQFYSSTSFTLRLSAFTIQVNVKSVPSVAMRHTSALVVSSVFDMDFIPPYFGSDELPDDRPYDYYPMNMSFDPMR